MWALNLVEVEVAVPTGETSFSLGCLVSLGVTLGCSFPTSWRSGMLALVSCFRIVFDSAGSAGVVFGLTRVVVKAFLYFCCFVVLCGRRFSLYYFVELFCFRLSEFLLLWLVRNWLSLLSLVREAHPPTLFR
ncbi:hypothetical protein Taro_052311 [Colocasia esculenta]|uniref:Transmembrane protein n=1 Tax=Colocasia esculenta TaxID=4460 RepID=A0A843XI93_COLES|nr:hypothetical protein [Colocasia esculenta]